MSPLISCTPLYLLLTMFCQTAEEPDAAVEKERQERLKYMVDQLETVRIETTGDKPKILKRMEHPVLRYTNPIRSSAAGGATFLWLDEQRPLIAASISIRENNNVAWEFASLTNEKLNATRQETAFWTPTKANRPAEVLRDAPEPSEKPALRSGAVRALARRFNCGPWRAG